MQIQERAEFASRSFKENCLQWRQPIGEVALYAQMNEFTLQGIYHFKGNSFSASSFGFHLEDKSGKTRGMGFTELQLQLSGIGEWETDERKRSSMSSSKWHAARKSHLRFKLHVQSLFYFASYRCWSAAFFAMNRQGNNWWAIRTRLTFSITLVKYVLLSSCHANRGYILNIIE